LTTDRLVTCGGGDLEGGRLPPDDGIGDDLHAAHLHWVVPPLFCRNTTKSSPSEEKKKARKHSPAKTKLETGTLLEARLLQYSTAVALKPEGRRRSTAAAAKRRWRRLRCLGVIIAGGCRTPEPGGVVELEQMD